LLGEVSPGTIDLVHVFHVALGAAISHLPSPARAAATLVGLAGLAGCSTWVGSMPPLAAPLTSLPAPAAAPDEPAAPAAALPFRLPCAADDVVGCINSCNDKVVEDCVTLGAMYLQGTIVSVDPERAVELFQTACAADSARGCMRLGDAYHAGIVPVATGGGDAKPRDPHAEEVLLYRRACDGGANLGCVLAGRAFVAGHGVARDAAQAAKLFAQVCDRGNAESCLELGKLAQRGDGVKRDADRALGLYRKACGLGLAEACLHASPQGDEHSPRE
jgi:TPR repeat protein